MTLVVGSVYRGWAMVAPVAQERPLAGTSLAAVQGVGGAREIPGGLIVDPSSSAGIKRKLEAQQGR